MGCGGAGRREDVRRHLQAPQPQRPGARRFGGKVEDLGVGFDVFGVVVSLSLTHTHSLVLRSAVCVTAIASRYWSAVLHSRLGTGV
eukprot:3909468-Rhodomonas_salina.2